MRTYLFLCLFTALAGVSSSQSGSNGQPAKKSASTNAPNNQPQAKCTNFGARQAFARLSTDIQSIQKGIIPSRLYTVDPGAYSTDIDRSLTWVTICSWWISFADANGLRWIATVDSRGQVNTRKDTAFDADLPPFAPEDWLLDFDDAQLVAWGRGSRGLKGAAQKIRLASLQVRHVEGVGPRLIWFGPWQVPGGTGPFLVDAKTGATYESPRSSRLIRHLSYLPRVPVSSEEQPETGPDIWYGGYIPSLEEKSPQQYDYSPVANRRRVWQPVARTERFVYNYPHLAEQIKAEESRGSRDAASWASSGVAYALIGEFIHGVRDLDKAILMEPNNDDYVFYRGVMFLAIRNFDRANSDFIKIRDGKLKVSARRSLTNLRAGLLDSVVFPLKTNFGWVPFEIRGKPMLVDL